MLNPNLQFGIFYALIVMPYKGLLTENKKLKQIKL